MTPTDQRSLRERLFGSRAGALPVLTGPQASLHRARALTRTEGIPAEIATEAAQLGRRLGAGSLLAADPIRIVSTYLASVGGTPAQRELLNRLIWQEYIATRCPGRDLADLANQLAASPAEVLAEPFRALGTAADTLLAALAARPLGDQRAISTSGAVVQAEKQLRQEALEGGLVVLARTPPRPGTDADRLADRTRAHRGARV